MRPLRLTDLHMAYVEGLNSPEVNRFLDGVKHSAQTMESVKAFVSAEASSINSVLLGIWPYGSSQHVGTVRVHSLDHRHGTAHIGVCLFDKAVWGKGIGRNAIRAATEWAMQTFSLRWIEAGAYEANLASQRAFTSAGYEWVFDIPGKYLLEDTPTTVKVYAARW